MHRLPRDLHPVAWWLWALGVAAGATMTSNPFVLLFLVAATALVVNARRADHPWSFSFRIYLWIGLAIVVIRVLFRVLVGGGYGTVVLFTLPQIPLPEAVMGLQLLGPITAEAVLGGLYDGMRLATIVIAVGAANSLANPKRLLKSVPPALYEIGTALVVAVTVLPQLADSVRRVRAAQGLRPGPSGRVRRLRRFLVPVLEDALERSLRLAAGMDVRGYGRSAGLSAGQRVGTGALMLTGLVGACVGVYAVLDTSAPRYLAQPLLLGGVAVAVLGMVNAGRRVRRSRYRPDPWRGPEWSVALAGVACGVLLQRVLTQDPLLAHPGTLTVPQVAPLALVAILVVLIPAVAAPPALSAARREAAFAVGGGR